MTIRFVSDQKLEEIAEQFLNRYLPTRRIPIPIEEIAECDLGLEIRFLSGLRERFGVDGFISNDQETLCIDEELMTKYPARFRYTIAHEIAHRILHSRFIEGEYPSDIADWKRRILQRDPALHHRLETQANRLAGCILVPREPLSLAWEETKMHARRRGLAIEELDAYELSTLAARIGDDFRVSGDTVKIALERCELIQRQRVVSERTRVFAR